MLLSFLTRRSLVYALSAALLLAAASARGEPANSAWPVLLHDSQNTGRSDLYRGPQGPSPVIAWEYKNKAGRTGVTVGPPIPGSPNGVVYFGDGKKPITALNPDDGSVIWHMTDGSVGQADKSTPSVGANGAVYMGERGNNLWAADADDGGIQWKFKVPVDGDVRTSPAIALDGTIFMASGAIGNGRTYAMNPDGTIKWQISFHAPLQNIAPALSLDEQTVYFGVNRSEVAAVDAATGAILWRIQYSKRGRGGSKANHSVVVGPDGTLYFGSRDGLFAIDPTDGSVLWHFDTGDLAIQSAPALAADGTLYVGASGVPATFFAINGDGTLKWKHVMTGGRGRFLNNQAVIDADGTIFVTYSRFLYSFDPAGDGMGGGKVNWLMVFRRSFKNGPAIGGDGVLYVANGRSVMKVVDP